MSRKRVISKREILPDPKYNSSLAAKFINSLMRRGKKSVAQSILYDAMDIIREKTKEDPLGVFQKAMSNVKPIVEVKSRRVGGSTYQVPTEVKPSRSQALSMRWVISFCQGEGGEEHGGETCRGTDGCRERKRRIGQEAGRHP